MKDDLMACGAALVAVVLVLACLVGCAGLEIPKLKSQIPINSQIPNLKTEAVNLMPVEYEVPAQLRRTEGPLLSLGATGPGKPPLSLTWSNPITWLHNKVWWNPTSPYGPWMIYWSFTNGNSNVVWLPLESSRTNAMSLFRVSGVYY